MGVLGEQRIAHQGSGETVSQIELSLDFDLITRIVEEMSPAPALLIQSRLREESFV